MSRGDYLRRTAGGTREERRPSSTTRSTGGFAGSGLQAVTETLPGQTQSQTFFVSAPPPKDDGQQNIFRTSGSSGDGSSSTGTGDGGERFTSKGDDTPPEVIDQTSGILSNIFGKPIEQLNPLELEEALRKLSLYQPLDLNLLQKRGLMTKNIFDAIFRKGTGYTDLKGNPVTPTFRMNEDGKQEMFFIDEEGNEQPVRYSREGIEDLFSREDLRSLKKFNPEIYYPSVVGGMPATSGGLLDLATNETLDTRGIEEKLMAQGLSLKEARQTEEYKNAAKYNSMIFDARTQLQNMDRNPNTGTSTRMEQVGSPAFAPPTQPGTQPPGTQPPGTQPPGTPPIPFPVATGAGITPFNINQFYASLPQYTQQGIMSPSLAQYFQNLQAFPRII